MTLLPSYISYQKLILKDAKCKKYLINLGAIETTSKIFYGQLESIEDSPKSVIGNLGYFKSVNGKSNEIFLEIYCYQGHF